ncbi:MAG TPA: hypothetical protein VMF11_01390 [Candidatus Baltobacteraceae bacterium]|nr:hypothetical protein [Candidatus Baltobacteraceae bacterium]
MRKKILTLTALVALGACVTFGGAVSAGPSAPAPLTPGTWDCETTQPNPAPNLPRDLHETDHIEYIGKWLHGTARSSTAGSPDPYYDYYLAHLGSRWVYIQVSVDPANPSLMNYFVGTSHDAQLRSSHWRIVYPAETGEYQVAEVLGQSTVRQFSIKYADLTQVCANSGSYLPPAPAATLKCTTTRLEPGDAGAASFPSYLSITKMAADITANAKVPTYWWQGVATNSPSGGRIIYEYNIFSIQGRFYSIEINGDTGSYAIAESTAAQDLANTSWTVVYPQLENGFTFGSVTYGADALPQAFDLYFADGYQHCGPLRAGR